jgi:NAD(P)-dependent dehydrogenase (short-subunit alcohol dehydrogenase family)
VASEAHRKTLMSFDDLQFEKGYNGRPAYNQSKLANLLFTYELSRRMADTNMTVNALHPGFVKTHLGKQNKLVRTVMDPIHALFAKEPENAAQTPIYLAGSPEVQDVTGKYFIKKEAIPSSEASYDQESAQRLWQVSEELGNFSVSEMEADFAKYGSIAG